MSVSRRTIHDLADGSLLVEYPDLPDTEANARAVAAASRLERERPRGFLGAVPGARTLYVELDPEASDRQELSSLLGAAETSSDAPLRRTLTIPVVYGAEAGPDLGELASRANLSADEFARRHAQETYRVAFLGFAPGFAYLTGLPDALHAPRLATPRTRVPAGTVAIGGAYTGIYPGETPGGWRLIGRTSVQLFDADSDPPAIFAPGDRIVFEPAAMGLETPRPALIPAPADTGGPPLFRVVSPGVFGSVQGGPRYGWSRWGVPPGGAMDPEALARGNERLGNPADAPALEMTLVGSELAVLADAIVFVSGAEPEVELNGRAMEMDEPRRVRTGDRLKVARIQGGARTYLCVEGGLGLSSRPRLSPRVHKDDVLHLPVPPSPRPPVPYPPRVPASPCPRVRSGSLSRSSETVVRVVLGPQRDRYTQEGLATFLSSIYRVSLASDRRGIRLEGAPIELARPPDIAPEGTPLGGIQVASDGLPIVLGPDRPVTGGYARIATVIRADFPLLAQAVAGSGVRFAAVDLAEALAARVG